MPAIFISYRRDDTSSATGRLTDSLAARFGPDEIFRDIKTIDPGTDFRSALRDALRTAQVVLVVIGRFWAGLRGSALTRLHEPDDYVRREIEEALAQHVPIVPILVEGARMPAAEELPESIRALAFLQAHEISESRWNYDADRLVELLAERSGITPRPPTHTSGTDTGRSTGHEAWSALAQLPSDFLRLVYEPRRFLVAQASNTRGSLARAVLFLVFSQLAGAALILQTWPTRSRVVDFLVAPAVVMPLGALVASLPLYAAWRVAGVRHEYRRVLTVLLYQVSMVGMCLSVVAFIMLLAIEIAVPGIVDRFALTPTVDGASAVLVRLRATSHLLAWAAGSMIAALLLLATTLWLAVTWGAYRLALDRSRMQSLRALTVFAALFFGPIGLLIWIATLI